MRPTPQARQVPRFALLLVAAWCVMTVAHEAGHVVCGWAGGGTLVEADLAPWGLPHSRFDPDPRPLVTLWGGPVLGAAVPVVAAIVVRRGWAWFVATFCLLANGSYLAAGWLTGQPHLDTPRLLHHGAHPATVAAYCGVTLAIGYAGFRRQCVRLLSPGGG